MSRNKQVSLLSTTLNNMRCISVTKCQNIHNITNIWEKEKYFNIKIFYCGGVKNPLLDWSLLQQLWHYLVSKEGNQSKNMQKDKCIKNRHPPKETHMYKCWFVLLWWGLITLPLSSLTMRSGKCSFLQGDHSVQHFIVSSYCGRMKKMGVICSSGDMSLKSGSVR